MTYISKRKETPSFTQKGLKGFRFPIKNEKVEIYFVDVEKGHDTFIISKEITHTYYILEGKGFFVIEGERYDAEPGMIIEVPPKLEYTYSGKMKLILIMNPPWFKGNDESTKKNPDVYDSD